jgi:hypothetical protein
MVYSNIRKRLKGKPYFEYNHTLMKRNTAAEDVGFFYITMDVLSLLMYSAKKNII